MEPDFSLLANPIHSNYGGAIDENLLVESRLDFAVNNFIRNFAGRTLHGSRIYTNPLSNALGRVTGLAIGPWRYSNTRLSPFAR
jgi:hypothetical protein